MTSRDGIAIVGIGCRFPGGANSPESFWKLLRDGVDAVTEVPQSRWNIDRYYDPTPGTPGKTCTRWGGFVDGIDQFDPQFFDLSPREANLVDPQQRLLLETAWEALEDGGQVLDVQRGSDAGVFIGISHNDFAFIQSTPADRTTIDIYTPTGSAHSVAANRLSYFLNLHGPSVAVDTACSSSLTAIHFACQSIWRGECPLALAGGVNVIINPEAFIGFSLASMLSPDGRCYAFDARANGFVRAEGAGMVVLKPLSEALADEDRIYAVILGTAANQDGRSKGLTVPSAAAQETLVHQACRDAGVSANEIGYLEAHGTGTPVGDPIEIQALGAALSPGRAKRDRCLVGSVKTNIGHLESAAGIAGLVKATLALHNDMVPPHIHFSKPNPDLHLEDWKLQVCTRLEEFPRNSGRALAGVNSFGFGGANAHVVLGQPPQAVRPAQSRGWSSESRTHLLPLSARTSAALRATAEQWREFLHPADGDDPSDLRDICYTAGRRRHHHEHRLSVVGGSRAELAERLTAFLEEDPADGTSSGRSPSETPQVVFVFSGQGPQWWAMGRELLNEEPAFREAIEQCDQAIARYADWTLYDEFTAREDKSRLDQTAIAQPAIFALQVALARLWQSWGIEPAAIVGHSVGEVAAAHLAGILTLEDAARVVFHRGRCMETTNARGRMLAVGLSAEDARLEVAAYTAVYIAAINSPASVTLSGDGEELETIALQLEKRNVFCRFVRVQYPFHTPLMESAALELTGSLPNLTTEVAKIPIYSSVTGMRAEGPQFGARHWANSVRNPVLFAPAVDALIEAGQTLFLELSPHPVLKHAVHECLQQRSQSGTVLSSLRQREPEGESLRGSLGALYTLGCPVAWDKLEPEGRCTRLPTYAWQKSRYWHEADDCREFREAPPSHPLLGRKLKTADPRWEVAMSPAQLPYLADHQVQGRVVVPATGYVEMALAAADELFGDLPCVLEDVEFERALLIPEGDQAPRAQLSYSAADGSFEIHSLMPDAGSNWLRNASGSLRKRTEDHQIEQLSLDALRSACTEEVTSEQHYQTRRDRGIQFGSSFQTVQKLWRKEGASFGQVQIPTHLEHEAGRYRIHPVLLDACLQVFSSAPPQHALGEKSPLYLPVRVHRLRVHARPGTQVWVAAELVQQTSKSFEGNIRVLDENGMVLIEMEGLRCQTVEGTSSRPEQEREKWLYELQWQLEPLADVPPPCRPGDYMPSLQHISERVHQKAVQMTTQSDWYIRYQQALPELDRLCRAYLRHALDQLGWQPQVGQRFTADALMKRFEIAEKYHLLFDRYLAFLAQDGQLVRRGDEWEVCQVAEEVDILKLWRTILARCPAAYPELTLIARCGRQLAKILLGQADALEVIFADTSWNILEHLYSDGWSSRRINMVAREAVAAALERLPEGRRLRILEIGAGTGGMTSYVLPQLPLDQIEYVFTDVSGSFFARAEQRFQDYSGLEFRVLDLERPPTEQGFEPHAFDLILASDVLHATTDLRQSLARVKQLLAPEGLFAFVEIVKPIGWVDLVFGLTDGWWKFQDRDLRPDYPLLARRQWETLLEECGFPEAIAVSGSDQDSDTQHMLFLACGPKVAQPIDARPPQTPDDVKWLIFADQNGAAARLANSLRADGAPCLLVSPGEEFRWDDDFNVRIRFASGEDCRELWREIGSSHCGVIHMASLDAPCSETMDAQILSDAEGHGCHSVIHLVQALTEISENQPRGLWLVTSGAQPVGQDAGPLTVAQVPLCGLGRVIANEQPGLHCQMIDLSAAHTDQEIEALARELRAEDGEPEVALRGEARYVQRLARGSLQSRPDATRAMADQPTDFRLETSRPGLIDNLMLRACSRPAPAAGEVSIKVSAAALNFRDVMKALGIYPTEAGDAAIFGDECVGRVTAIGPDVSGLNVGDEVLAIGGDCFASHITVPAALVLPKPSGLTDEEAVTLPVAFLTAQYALHYLGRIRSGERVLIHSAAGGVGLAAVQIALRAGAVVFATAGSKEKRELLRNLGATHVMDSRSLEFADEIRRVTDGEGVDLVLNSLAGQAIAKGLDVLRPFGRFLELGKRDIYQNQRLAMRVLRNNLSFFAIDLGQAMVEQPALVRSLLDDLTARFAAAELHPLPLRVSPINDVRNAFRTMERARHVGKLVVSLAADKASRVEPRAEEKTMEFSPEATYLITGGLGGFGLAVAGWMVQSGARNLVLVGRSGASTAEAQEAVAGLERLGARVVVARCDVTDARQVHELFDTMRDTLPPLRGVIHAAMVIDDGTVQNLTPERFSRVTAPKVLGAWNLHLLTRDLPLDFFVMFSSASTIVGNPGQGNYAAANAFLDGLAHYRHALGLTALTVNWGVLGEVGYVSRQEKVAEFLARQGSLEISPLQATEMLGRLLTTPIAQIAIMRLDWQKFVALYPHLADSPRFSEQVAAVAVHKDSEQGDLGIREAILAASAEKRRTLMESYLLEKVAKVLCLSPGAIDLQRPLNELVLDSLIGMELVSRIESELHLTIPIAKLLAGGTIAGLAADLLEMMDPGAAIAGAADAPQDETKQSTPSPVAVGN